MLACLFLMCMAIVSCDAQNALAAKAGDMALGALLLAMRGNGQPDPPSGITANDVATPKPKDTV